MYCFCLFLMPFLGKSAAFQQNDYNLTSERMEFLESDEKWVLVKSANFKYNRTCAAINLTIVIIRDFTEDVEVDIQAYKLASNQYRLFPITFKINFCETLKKNEFGIQNLYHCGNFTGCPFVKGTVRICNWTPDGSKFPPHAPSGRYMMDMVVLHSSQKITRGQWYMKIEKRITFG